MRNKLFLIALSAVLAGNAVASAQLANLKISATAVVPEVVDIKFEDGTRSADLGAELKAGHWVTNSKQLTVSAPMRLTARLVTEPKMVGLINASEELPFEVELANTMGSTVTLTKANSKADLYKGADIRKPVVFNTSIKPTFTKVNPDIYSGKTDIVIESTL